MNPSYSGLKQRVVNLLNKVPVVGDPVERLLGQIKESIKAGLHGGMLFEELGFRYVGPVDGHNIASLRRYLKMVKKVDGPVLLHVFTEKGHGFQPAAADPVYFHTPAPFERADEKVIAIKAELVESVYRCRQPGGAQADGAKSARHGADRGHVPGKQTGSGARRVSAAVFRRGHLRIARRGVCRRTGESRAAADRRYLQHVSATQLRSDVPGSGAAKLAGDVFAGSRRA